MGAGTVGIISWNGSGARYLSFAEEKIHRHLTGTSKSVFFQKYHVEFFCGGVEGERGSK